MSETSDPEQDSEMQNMFASVWVKVEVVEEDEELTPPGDRDKNFAKTNNRRIPRETLRCESCDYTTTYKNSLKIHMMGHDAQKPFNCSFCDYTTKYPTSLHRHELIQHKFKKSENENAPIHKCDYCNYTTFFKWNLNAHRRKHKLEKQFKCDHCSYSTAYRHNYMKHSKVHAKEEVIYKCDKCPFVTKYEGHISRHLAKIHNEVSEKANRCDLCDFSTKVKWRLNTHKQRSRQKESLKCAYCEFETFYRCESKKHKGTHYSEIYGVKSVGNENRNAKKERLPEMETKLPVIEPELPVIEPELPEIEPDLPEIDSNQSPHEKTNHYTLDPNCEVDWNNIQVIESSNKDSPFQCIMCKYTSKFKASVQRHFQRHHTGPQNRPYKCCNCDFSTKTKDQISLHNKRSQSEMQLRCSECPFSTFFKCQYAMHQKCHYTQKCTACDYTCKHKYEVQKHYSIVHLGNGLKCRFCDYQATRKGSLLCHETMHTGNKPFKCEKCDYKSVRKSLLENHIKRYHFDVSKDTVVVSDNKIQSLKICVSEKLRNENVIQEIRDNILTIEDIISSNDGTENSVNSNQKQELC